MIVQQGLKATKIHWLAKQFFSLKFFPNVRQSVDSRCINKSIIVFLVFFVIGRREKGMEQNIIDVSHLSHDFLQIFSFSCHLRITDALVMSQNYQILILSRNKFMNNQHTKVGLFLRFFHPIYEILAIRGEKTNWDVLKISFFPTWRVYICNRSRCHSFFQSFTKYHIREVLFSAMSFLRGIFARRTATRSHVSFEPVTPMSPISNTFDDVEEDENDYSSCIQQELAGKNSRYFQFLINCIWS